MIERRYDIDWLRIIIVVMVLLMHSALLFSLMDWHLNSTERIIGAHIFVGWFDSWFMPLFFLIGGFSTFFGLEKRTSKQYVIDRFKRVLVPLYSIGLFVILLPVFYFDSCTHAEYSGSMLELIPTYFRQLGNFNISSPQGIIPLPFAGHLWFLQFVFLISLITLPLLKVLDSEKGKKFINALADLTEKRGGMLLFLIPIFISRVCLRSFFEGDHTWADFVEFIVFYLIGYMFASNRKFNQNIKSIKFMGLILGLVGFGVGHGIIILLFEYNYPGGDSFSLKFICFQLFFSIGRFGWIIFALNLASRYLNFNNKFLKYGQEATLPFYIIHQPVLLGVAWYVLHLQIGIVPQIVIIFLSTFVIVFIIYELLIRRFNFVRVLFGMRLRKSS